MLRWLFQRKQKPEALLRQIADYNLKLHAIADDPETRRNPLHANAARLKLVAPLATPKPGDSWLGGSPRLPDPFVWPRKDGKPLYFLGQIACSALPADIWGGLGPRSGYLAFFVGMGKHIAATAVHAAELGPERLAPEPWPDCVLPSITMRSATREIYDSVPCWKLAVSAAPKGGGEAMKQLIDNPGRSPKVDLTKPAFWPYDWRSFRLLLAAAMDDARRRAEQARKSLVAVESRLQNGKPDIAMFRRLSAESLALRSKLAELASQAPWQAAIWIPFAVQLSGWKQAEAAEALRTSQNLFQGYKSLKFAASELLEVSAQSPSLAPQLKSELEGIVRRASEMSFGDAELRDLLRQIPSTPKVWGDFRGRFPDYWRRAVAEIADKYANVCGAEIALRPVEGRSYINGKPRPPWGSALNYQNSFPTSWDEALAFADRYIATAQASVTSAENFEVREGANLAGARDQVTKAEAAMKTVAAEVGRMEAAEGAEAFDILEWLPAISALQESEMSEFWATGYEAARYRLAAFAYARDPESLPAAVRGHFEARWANDVDYEIAAMGGLPDDWSYDMMDGVNTRVMLLELPSSHLLGWQWGDVHCLVISVAVDDLKRNRFRDVRADITN